MQYFPIAQLSQLVANQIAAGEVVERPSSVVKELVENSLDAGATKIELEIEGGGMHLIRVRDNGCGIKKSDLMLAFARHATSKICSTEDLAAITSLGFRGEALASISSVSRCRLTSKQIEEVSAWQIQFDCELVPHLSPVAHPIGTTVEVADLFYNTPARRKFLRSEKTEFQAIEEVLKRLSLAFPQVSFSLKHQQRQVKFYPRAGTDEAFRIAKICGQSFMDQAIEISMSAVGLSLKGWLGLPTLARRQADCQYFFVNQRMVKDRFLNHIIKTIYQQYPQMPEGTYPCYVLYLTLDPSEVDVNVHPTKQEVRFSQARLIHDFMNKVIRETLTKVNNDNAIEQDVSVEKQIIIERDKELQDDNHSSAFTFHQKINDNKLSTSTAFFHRYACIENEKGVFVVDLSLAKGALLTYYFKKNWGKVPIKTLLFPLRVYCAQQNLYLQETIENLAAIGFQTRLENKEIILLTQPEFLKTTLSKELLEKIVHLTINKKCNEWPILLAKNLAILVEDFTSPIFHDLLLEWITKEEQGPWCHFSHELIAEKMQNLQPIEE